ncbi:MAG: prepilin-type N-terminal cleavage/methylation domain-containing protein, partial [Candidatus Marinimicrobia bacterium]|nr:prepilin-type N-terminal cleavage/methylation domain-containing protein [Candidatus Neomarinimicrobiota bacterium]
MKRNNKEGFTLVEIMIVVLIIALLAAIAVPSFMRARERSRTSACINNLRQIDSAKEQWAMEEQLNTGDALG